MPEGIPKAKCSPEDLQFQNESLAQVSRTFAMTIPELPEDLRIAVGNAYLWCRVADTIEDTAGIPYESKCLAFDTLSRLFDDNMPLNSVRDKLSEIVIGKCSDEEFKLFQNLTLLYHILENLTIPQQDAIVDCVLMLSEGMEVYQGAQKYDGGISTLKEFNEYCYYVAGVVGEMLTKFFCEYSADIADHRWKLMPLSVSFGQALQMTNILKDVWSDKDREMCWLPSEVFEKHGFDLKNLHLRQPDAGFEAAMLELLDIAQGYLAESLDYVCLLPPEETGIRRFCLYALGMAVLTLQKIRQNPRFTNADDVKISRETVQEVVQKVNEICGDNDKLRAAFAAMSLG